MKKIGKLIAIILIISVMIPFFTFSSVAQVSETSVTESLDEWSLLWSDEFDDGVLNEDLWCINLDNSPVSGEQQAYTAKTPKHCTVLYDNMTAEEKAALTEDFLPNIEESDGTLKIHAYKLNSVGSAQYNNKVYTSGKLTSYDETTNAFLNDSEISTARIDVRVKLPGNSPATAINDAYGCWPAVWMMGGSGAENWPKNGEIDIMENVNGKGWYSGSVHINYEPLQSGFNNLNSGFQYMSNDDYSEWHIFSLIKEENKILWLLDGVCIGQLVYDGNVTWCVKEKTGDTYTLQNISLGTVLKNVTVSGEADVGDYVTYGYNRYTLAYDASLSDYEPFNVVSVNSETAVLQSRVDSKVTVSVPASYVKSNVDVSKKVIISDGKCINTSWRQDVEPYDVLTVSKTEARLRGRVTGEEKTVSKEELPVGATVGDILRLNAKNEYFIAYKLNVGVGAEQTTGLLYTVGTGDTNVRSSGNTEYTAWWNRLNTEDFYIILNLAMGGSMPNVTKAKLQENGLPIQTMEIDYVRVYRLLSLDCEKIDLDNSHRTQTIGCSVHVLTTDMTFTSSGRPFIALKTPTVVWSSDHSEVASVDENGTVTAHSVGTAIITAEVQAQTFYRGEEKSRYDFAVHTYRSKVEVTVSNLEVPQEVTEDGSESSAGGTEPDPVNDGCRSSVQVGYVTSLAAVIGVLLMKRKKGGVRIGRKK